MASQAKGMGFEMTEQNEWTTERQKRFWEAIPTEHEWQSTEDKWGNLKCKWCGEIRPKSMLVTTKCRPDITDLNALFKWAVPMLFKYTLETSWLPDGKYHVATATYEGKWSGLVYSKDPAQALAEAIEKALNI